MGSPQGETGIKQPKPWGTALSVEYLDTVRSCPYPDAHQLAGDATGRDSSTMGGERSEATGVLGGATDGAETHGDANGGRGQARLGVGGFDDEAALAWWAAEPCPPYVAHGVADRVERLKATGDGQVPVVAAAAFLYLRSVADKARI